MRLSFGKPSSSDSPDTVNVPGGTFNHPIILTRAPLVEIEAATKSYVDNSITNLSTGAITTGVLASAQLPAIGGDFISATGTNVIMYAPTNVAGGWMSRVVLDNKGRVLEGGQLQVEDYPEMDFSLFADGMPFNYRDYGITDVLDSSGGTLVDNVRLLDDPSDPYHASTKAYADAKAATGGGSGLSVGDIVGIYNPTMSDEAGMLRCNGAQVDIAAYPDLYAKIGDATDASIKHGHGRPWEQQKGVNTLQSVDITGWQTTNPLPGARLQPLMFATKNRVYTTGGHTGTGFNATVHGAVINSDGTLGTWSVVGSTSFTNGPTQATASVIVVKDRVFIFGENAGTGNFYCHAVINADGTLAAFSGLISIPFQPSKITFCLGNKIYVVRKEGVYMAEVNDSGDLSPWAFINGAVGNYESGGMLAITKNRVYILGYSDVTGRVGREALVTGYDQNGELDTWSTVTVNGPTIAQSPCCYVTDKMVYILGSGTGYNKVDRIEVLSDGSLGNWSTGTDLPGYKTAAGLLATSTKLYLFGGSSGGSPESTVFMGNITGGVNDFTPYYLRTAALTAPTPYSAVIGNGRPWEQQYHFNTEQAAIFGSTIQYGTTPITMQYTVPVVTKNKVFLIGGMQDSVRSAQVKRVQIIDDSVLDPVWENWNLLPKALFGHRVLVIAGAVYVIGGIDFNGAFSTSVYRSVIDENGDLGAWSEMPALPTATAFMAAVVVGRHIRLYGGLRSGNVPTADCWEAELTSAGLYSSWTPVSPLSSAVSYPVVAVTKSKLYLIGGSGTAGGYSVIHEASIQSDGSVGAMSVSLRTNPITDARYSSCIVTRNHVYLLQAYDGSTNYLGRVYGAAIDSEGNIGPWSIYFTRSTITKVDATVFVVRDKLYLMGGTDPTAAQPATRMFHTNFLGGQSDYSLYNSKPISIYQVPTKFYLPYVDKPDLPGVSYYVKY